MKTIITLAFLLLTVPAYAAPGAREPKRKKAKGGSK